jgi:hypothetical protein
MIDITPAEELNQEGCTGMGIRGSSIKAMINKMD